jgi:hypothetical protein
MGLSFAPESLSEDEKKIDVTRTIWPVLKKFGEIQDFDSPESMSEEAKARDPDQQLHNYNLIEVEAYVNKWGIDSLWLYIDFLKRRLQIMGVVNMDTKNSPEEIQRAMASLIRFREDLKKAGYVLSENINSGGSYDIKFDRPVDTQDSQKTYAAIDAFISIL